MNMLNLFSTTSDTAGFRLHYMEIYNWGTFHEKIFRMSPQGNNALLTGANASGKSTWIDALLTLLVPVKKDRFYNQSSGVEKKGNRTEETYVLGHYGNIQKEGEKSATTQALRDQSAYSVLLATFTNTDQRAVTIFQVRWFSSGELRRVYGVAHRTLDIKTDFQPFDGKGIWRRRLENAYKGGGRNMVEFFDGPTAYAERITQVFGMRSIKALSLFNQIVGVKVLDDLDEFIRTNMLEELDAENQYIQLKESFTTLIEAKNNIEKAGEQILRLRPIAELADKIQEADMRLKQLTADKDTAVYWFAKKTIDLAQARLSSAEKSKTQLSRELDKLREKEERLKEEERSLAISLEKDESGRKIKELETEIKRLTDVRDARIKKMDAYNELASRLSFHVNPSYDVFEAQRSQAIIKVRELEDDKEQHIRRSIELENRIHKISALMEENVGAVERMHKNRNNIPVRETEIRDAILEFTGASKKEIPFIGELIRVSPDNKEWQSVIEKILHSFALHIIVPDEYYHKVTEYVNSTNLNGRITFYRYRTYNSLAGIEAYDYSDDTLLGKIEIKPDSPYAEWIRDVILEKFNYTCVESLEDFERYTEKVVTREGLIKYSDDRHEKDDRLNVTRKENYILDWDNKEKIVLLQKEIRELQQQENELTKELNNIGNRKLDMQNTYELYRQFIDTYSDYEQIEWQEYTAMIQRCTEHKEALEKDDSHILLLQKQLDKVRQELQEIAKSAIENKSREIFSTEHIIEQTTEELMRNQHIISSLRSMLLTDFEENYDYLKTLEYEQLKQEQIDFQRKNERARNKIAAEKRNYEDEVKIKITEFKHPEEYLTDRFKDWRSDVDALPDASHIDLIGEYQQMLKRLEEENLPRYEQQFDNYLQKTLTDKVGEFRMFFMNWTDSIKENIRMLNDSLKDIDYRIKPVTYIQLTAVPQINEESREFRRLMDEAVPDMRSDDISMEQRRLHFYDHVEPFMRKLDDELWRNKVMDARAWFSYKAEEFNKATGKKENTYENMGHLSGGEKAQLTYTILGSAIAYQFGLTKGGLQNNSFRFIAIDEAFKAQDEDKARYLITLCKQLHLQLLVVTPNDNIHIVENDISYVYFVERREEKTSWLYSMPIEKWGEMKKIHN